MRWDHARRCQSGYSDCASSGLVLPSNGSQILSIVVSIFKAICFFRRILGRRCALGRLGLSRTVVTDAASFYLLVRETVGTVYDLKMNCSLMYAACRVPKKATNMCVHHGECLRHSRYRVSWPYCCRMVRALCSYHLAGYPRFGSTTVFEHLQPLVRKARQYPG